MTSPTVIAPQKDRATVNRENAQHSTGPRTEEGKQAVRLNAVKHGLYSQTLLIPEQDQPAFEKDRQLLESRYRPQTTQERELVQSLHESRWRLSRTFISERNLYRLVEEQQLTAVDELFGEQDENTRRALAQAAGFQANGRLFDQLSRQEARLQRTIRSIESDLEFLTAPRRQSKPTPEMTEQSQSAPQMPQFTGSLAEFKRKQWLKQQAKLNNPPNSGRTSEESPELL